MALATLAAPPSDAAICKTRDLMPEYFIFAAKTVGMAPDARAGLFANEFASRHPEFYVPEDFGGMDKIRKAAERFYDAGRQLTLPGSTPLTDESLRATSRAAGPALADAEAQFAAMFPDFRCNAVVSMGMSLSRFDANAFTDSKGRDFVRLGIDMMARLHHPEDLPGVFSHMLFQIYFSQLHPEVRAADFDLIWQAMWVEGLGTYISLQMRPTAGEQKVLGMPDDLVAQMEQPGMMGKAAAAMPVPSIGYVAVPQQKK